MNRKIIKLKENREFRRAYSRGKSFVAPSFVIYIVKNRYSCVRLGITTGKKIGGAVERNRAKRVITAAFRNCQPDIKPGYDFVIVARTRILNEKSTVVTNLLTQLLESAGVKVESNDKQTAH